MTPREKEIALEAAARSSNPIEHARKVLEAEAFLRGERPPFVVWPQGQQAGELIRYDSLSIEEKAAWHEAQAAELRAQANQQSQREQEREKRLTEFRLKAPQSAPQDLQGAPRGQAIAEPAFPRSCPVSVPEARDEAQAAGLPASAPEPAQESSDAG